MKMITEIQILLYKKRLEHLQLQFGGGSHFWKGNVKVYKENMHAMEEVDKKNFFPISE